MRSARRIAPLTIGGHTAAWLDGAGPRRFFERTPLGVPILTTVIAATLAVGAGLHLVPAVVAWDVGGPLALFAEAFALYGWIAVRRARRAAGADD